MNVSLSEMNSLPFDVLKKMQNVNADLEIARRVVGNDSLVVTFFLKEFSSKFLDYIGKNIMCRPPVMVNGVYCYSPTVIAEYYEFIGAVFRDGKPTWHKLELYKGTVSNQRPARLYSYVSTISMRYFVKLKKKEDKEKKHTDCSFCVIENIGPDILNKYSGFDEIELGEVCDTDTEIGWAWKHLPEKDRVVLKYLVMEERNSLDVFDELIQYVDSKIPPSCYTRTQRQNAMSLLKQRAKKHLRKLIEEYRRKKTL